MDKQKQDKEVKSDELATEQKSRKYRSSHRPYNLFKYRGIPFFFVRRGDKSTLAPWNQETNSPEPSIVIKEQDKTAAVKALAKIRIAEKELEKLGAIIPEPI